MGAEASALPKNEITYRICRKCGRPHSSENDWVCITPGCGGELENAFLLNPEEREKLNNKYNSGT